MSDKLRAGDTSAPPPPAMSRPSINPLLSAAVTNLTLDDFTHNAMLLPAASPFMPIVALPAAPSPAARPPSVVGQYAEAAGVQQLVADGSHPPSVVFAGPGATAATLSNTDTFSEISLDYDESGASLSVAAPAQSATVAALSQLPSVASTVFSSFSNIISGITATDPAPAAVPPQHYQPYQPAAAAQFLPPQAPPVAPAQLPFGAPPPVAATPPVAQPPPRLYSPHDAAALAPAAGETGRPPSQLPPPVAGNANTYRLNQKRKIYAPLPGLNTTAAAEIPTSGGNRPPSAGLEVLPQQQQQQQQYQPPVVQQQQPLQQPTPPPPSFSFSSIIQKVPLLEKFQQLAVSPAPSHIEPAPTVSPAYNSQFVLHSEPLQPFVPQSSEPPQLFNPAGQQPMRKTSTPFSASPLVQPPPPASFYQPAPVAATPPQLPPTNHYQQSGQQLPPPTGAAGHLPPSGSAPPASSYRLKGKPLYKTPNTYGTVATPALFQPSEPNAAASLPPAQLYNPLESSGVPTTHSYVTSPVQPPVPVAPAAPAATVSDRRTPATVVNPTPPPVVASAQTPAPFVNVEQSTTNFAAATPQAFFDPTASNPSNESAFIGAFQPATIAPVHQQVLTTPASFFNPTNQYTSNAAPVTTSIFDAPAAPAIHHSWNPVAVPTPVSIFDPSSESSHAAAPASLFHPSAPTEAPAPPAIQHSWNPAAVPTPVSIFNPSTESSTASAPAPTTFVPAVAAEESFTVPPSSINNPSAPAIPSTEQTNAPAPSTIQHSWNPVAVPTPVSIFNPSSESSHGEQSSTVAPTASIFHPSAPVLPSTELVDAPAPPTIHHSWNPVAAPTPVSLFNPSIESSTATAPAPTTCVPTVAAEGSSTIAPAASIFHPSAPVIPSTEQTEAPPAPAIQHSWNPVAVPTPVSIFNPSIESSLVEESSTVAPAASLFHPSAPVISNTEQVDAPAAPAIQHSWNPVAVPTPVSIFNPSSESSASTAPAPTIFAPTFAAEESSTLAPAASIFQPSAAVISNTEQTDASVPVSIFDPSIQSSNAPIIPAVQTTESLPSGNWHQSTLANSTLNAPAAAAPFSPAIVAQDSNQSATLNAAQTPLTIFNPFANSEQSADFFAPPSSTQGVTIATQSTDQFAPPSSSSSVFDATLQPPADQANWFNPSATSNQHKTDELLNTNETTIYNPQEATEPIAHPAQFFNQPAENSAQPILPTANNPFQLPPPSVPSHDPFAALQNTIDLATINPVNFFEDTSSTVNTRRDSSFDKYISLEQQTTSSFIEPGSNANSLVPNVELPDVVAPGTYTADVNANQEIVVAPFANPTAPAATNFFETTAANSTAANPLASFFDSPASTAAAVANNSSSNWFNPIPTPQTTATSNTQTHSTPLHKPQPTDPVHFFNQSAAQPIPPSAGANNSASLDIVNNSHIANFFNNPPPLPDDATQQQLDLVKDCNRNFQATVNASGGTGDCQALNGGTSVISSGGGPSSVPHRRLGEIAQFDLFGGSISGTGSFGQANSGSGAIAGVETRSFASSVAVEPASSVQSELSEYAASAAGQSLAVGAPAVGGEEDDTEVQGFLEPPIVSAASPLNPSRPLSSAETDALDALLSQLHPEQLDSGSGMAASTGNIAYRPVQTHWFYNLAGLNDAETPQTPGSETGATGATAATGSSEPAAPASATTTTTKSQWQPFSASDSLRLQQAADAGLAVCTTNGGRFDVSLPQRRREPVYWKAPADEVRRCSWFWKGSDSRLVPYDEAMAEQLEAEYRLAAEQGKWNRKIGLPGGDTVVLHGPNVMVQFNKAQTPDSWTAESLAAAGGVPPAAAQTSHRPRIVRRGVEEWTIEEGESEQVDHLMFMVHGIGAACDLKFRTVEQVVEEFRSSAHQLVQSHFRHSIEAGRVGRIEVLPISWHSELHSEESGIDEKLRAITLSSIPKLRTFTNSTLLDILFYTSPVFCQQIIDAVANSINRKYQLYCERNPRFGGNVSLAGHSLGSVIVFDLLQNQRPDGDLVGGQQQQQQLVDVKRDCTVGQAGTGQQSILYPQLVFRPRMFFAFGSPIGMFVTVRGIHSLGVDYKLPTCPGFYNIFHPYDPVAYRIEALINADLAGLPPVLIPHHKGRKRMHLELRETIQRVGNDIKQRVVETFRSTMNRVYNLSPITLQKNLEQPDDLQQEVDEVLEREKQMALDAVESVTSSRSSTSGDLDESSGAGAGGIGASVTARDAALGALNDGRRVDYVLQEAPLEFFNEYLFALTSHVCYWESNDTTLFIAKEIYAAMGILTDHKQPQPQTTMLVPSADS